MQYSTFAKRLSNTFIESELRRVHYAFVKSLLQQCNLVSISSRVIDIDKTITCKLVNFEAKTNLINFLNQCHSF